eukprot:1459772-Pleurochrysis_carterae.AAC.1
MKCARPAAVARIRTRARFCAHEISHHTARIHMHLGACLRMVGVCAGRKRRGRGARDGAVAATVGDTKANTHRR